MPDKMDKKDVKISFKDAKSVNWTKVQQCSGVSIPSLAKEAVRAALEDKKNKKLAVKIGLIKKDLFLRIKNGDKHIQDVKLAKNWEPPKGWIDEGSVDDSDDEESTEGTQAPVDPNYQRDLQTWKKDKEDTKQVGEQVCAALQGLVNQSETFADRAEVEAERVAGGADNDNTALNKANEMVQRIQGLSQQADTAFQRYFVEFDRHRKGEKGENFQREDKEGYGIAFFMEKLKPLFQKGEFLKDAVATNLNKAQVAVRFITAHQQNGPAQAFLAQAQAFRQQLGALIQKSKVVLGGMTGDIEKVVKESMVSDQENVRRAETQDMKLARADQSLQRLAGIREAAPRMAQYLNESKQLLKDVGTKIPKTLLRDPQIGPEVNGFAASFKKMVAYHASWNKHASKAEEIYKDTLKLVNK